MNYVNKIHAFIANNIPFLFDWSLRKQSSKKRNTSQSILDKKTPFWIPMLLILPGLILITSFTIVPMVLNIINSFSDKQTDAFTVRNYANILTDPEFAVGVRNSFIYGMFVLPFVIMISLIISSVIAKIYRKHARGFWQTIFFMPYITNAVAVSLAFIQIFQINGLFNQIIGAKVPWLQSNDKFTFNALVAMVINGIWNGLAFNILIFTTAMLGVDKNLYRSASIDGASGVKQFFTITLPSIKGTINFLVTLGIIGGLKVFPLALFENKPDIAFNNGGATIMLYVYKSTVDGHWQKAGAASLLLFVIGVIYSSLVRGGFFMIQLSLNTLGERNVWVKVNASKDLKQKTT
ncbi:glycerol-3-phosphate ABC transporter permease [Mycoplasma sp. NEAQ87857]|uniref:carbohydrate ABC transporter permease n=1 Tax=Mycoplasma sp. NEAQ87857 TaxID=2683967 RepID=UPI0013191811|nr:sugar ABC transporter permease [Mycoplasma sp. NEAQ87857]QGZ97336.1 glycerol-3-phosphate ABC transporter permease [Mycoplasma sp. NEAQ87857]